MKIALGADHGGFKLKEEIKILLIDLGHTIEDVGCHSTESVDYPDIADTLTSKIIEHDCEVGILCCGTGIGMSIAVNRSRQIRAALCHDEYTARLSREHNNANILCLGERVTGVGVALEIVKTFIETQFAGGRHQRRVDMFSE
jgi:ribose 5-phosphate isomerase B